MQEINENEQKLMESSISKLSPNYDLLEVEFPRTRKPAMVLLLMEACFFLKKEAPIHQQDR